ncbi:hypothetical protein N480_02735 [Pseudoalteromonas luteoviolacea S2607]|nr:hypothetical protein N480_02735 [Pseudoalteromonas luteoviolacea S2607]
MNGLNEAKKMIEELIDIYLLKTKRPTAYIGRFD